MSITPDGKTLYVPSLEKDTWNVVDAATGDVLAAIETNSGAHNTVCGFDGKRMYLAGLKSPLLRVADTATQQGRARSRAVRRLDPALHGQRGPDAVLRQRQRPARVRDRRPEDRQDGTASRSQGFKKGPVKRHGCPSHGIGLTPDEKEIWVCDAANSRVHVFDATVMPPKQIASIKLREQPGWVTFSLDGRYAYPSTGDVIDAETKKVLTGLQDEKAARSTARRW